MTMPDHMLDWSYVTRLKDDGRRSKLAPLRKRRKRMHKKLARRGFSATPTAIIHSSSKPGYGIEGARHGTS